MKNITVSLAFLSLLLCMSCGDVEFANATPEARSCEATNSLVGETRALRFSSVYGISGNVTIVSDCEIEVTDFNYNGAGPNVSFYGASNGDFSNGVNMSEVLSGSNFSGETLNLFLPDGATFDEINSFSIWCFEFDVDFSSASFQ